MDFTDKQIENAFNSLRINKQRNAFNKGLRKSSNIFVKEYKKEIKDTFGSKSATDLNKGIGVSTFKKGCGVTIRITKIKDKTSKGWLLPMFELGSKPRYQKKNKSKKRYTGFIKPYRLFEKSREATENDVLRSMDTNIKQAIIDAWIKR